MRGNYKTIKNDLGWQYGTAYIVETRAHPNLSLVLKNAHACLPQAWSIMIFCGSENYLFADQVSRQFATRKIKLIQLDQPIESLQNYNDLLFSPEFWQRFETENLLGFQIDSLINPSQKHRLEEVAQYDYVGAPWSEGIQRRWDYIPEYGGNGGICFSKRSARLKALEQSTYPRVTGEPHHQILNEDIWFSHAIKQLGLSLPERELATQWFVESVASDSPFAMHKPWSYLKKEQYQVLLNQVQDLVLLQRGCEQKIETSDNDDYRRFLLRFARACLKEDNLYQTDLALQVCQNRYPKDPVAYNLQAMLAYRLELFEQANTFVKKALALKPGFNKAIENKAYIEKAIEQQKPTSAENQTRYLLIHSWGSGLGFDLLYFCLLYTSDAADD